MCPRGQGRSRELKLWFLESSSDNEPEPVNDAGSSVIAACIGWASYEKRLLR